MKLKRILEAQDRAERARLARAAGKPLPRKGAELKQVELPLKP